MMRILQSGIAVLMVCSIAGCSKNETVANGGWTWDDSGVLTFDGQPVTKQLAANQIRLITPLGTFVPRSDDAWNRVSFKIPLPDPSRSWVPMTVNSGTSATFTDEMKQQGYYRTDELPLDNATWTDTQLTGTPPNWVYACKVVDGKEHGYWIDPRKLPEIDWSKL